MSLHTSIRQPLDNRLILPPKTKPPAAHEPVRERWSPAKKDAFNALDPVAICLVGTEGPVSVVQHLPGGKTLRMGHNRGIWPMKVTKTSSWRDTVTNNEDKSPFVWQGVLARFWFGTEIGARKFQGLVADALAVMDEEYAPLEGGLRRDFYAVNPELDLDVFALQMADLARKSANAWWDDDGLSAWLDEQVAIAGPKLKGRR